MHRHDITLADGQVAGTVVAADQPSGAGVLFVHGLGSDRGTNIERAQALTATHGATCLAIDLRGHGGSGGRLSEVTPRDNLADVLAGFDALIGMPDVEPSRLGVCAASYGAYLSVLLSAERPVARLLLRAPALYADDRLDAVLARRRAGSTSESPRFVHALRALPMPVMLVESEHDEVISPAIVATYLAAQPAIDRVVIPGAGHALTDPTWRADFQRLLIGFFADL
ncbi:MAG: alpha/beta fold hydrolase [Jiangellales bacterium]